jgi:macrolide transport system ATP-binding/permease protein
MLDFLYADVRYALRWLRRSPGFTAVAVLSLAIGIGFNTALFTLVDAVLFRPLPVEQPDRLVNVYTNSNDGDTYATSSYLDYLDLKSKNDVFTDMLGFSPSFNAVTVAERSRLALGEVVTGSYFQVLGVKPLLGRTLLPEDDQPGAPRVAMLSYRLWAREYGAAPAAVGQTLRIHNQPFTIVGVAPPEFTGLFPVVSAEMWTTLAQIDDVEPGGIIDTVPSPEGTGKLDRRGYRFMFVIGRLKPGQTVDGAGANLSVLTRQLQTAFPATNADRRTSVKRTIDVRILPQADDALLPMAAGLMLAVGLMLLIACANVANMLLARASGRQREIAVRLAIGADRSRVVRQLLTESAVLASVGSAAGLGIAWALTRLMSSIHLPIPVPLAIDVQIDGRVLLFTLGATAIAVLAAGLAPSLRATRTDLTSELKGDATLAAGSRRWALRDGLVAGQMAVTVVLLVASGLLIRSVMAAQEIKLGFDPRGLAVVSAEMSLTGYDTARATDFFARALDRVSALPSVTAAGLAERTVFSVNFNRSTIFLPDPNAFAGRGVSIDSTRVSPGYFDAMGIPIVQGRAFNSADTPTSPGVVIINETMARKFWPAVNPIGQHIRRSAPDGEVLEVVGIAADHKVSTVGEAPTPYLHYAHSQRPGTGQAIVARTGADAGALVQAIQRELVALEPNVLMIEHQTMETQVGATLLPARLGAVTIGVVGVVAMALAAIGLYGVIAYSVSRRTREIGIRLALGAKPGTVLKLVFEQGMTVAGAGAVGGALLALGAAKLLSGALYGISPFDPLAWSAALLVLFAVAVCARRFRPGGLRVWIRPPPSDRSSAREVCGWTFDRPGGIDHQPGRRGSRIHGGRHVKRNRPRLPSVDGEADHDRTDESSEIAEGVHEAGNHAGVTRSDVERHGPARAEREIG